jgi:tetratricopeptide (TPR) repeat protein
MLKYIKIFYICNATFIQSLLHPKHMKMKKTILILILGTLVCFTHAQDPNGAEKLVGEGVQRHDKGDYVGAIAKYDQALALDKDNLLAMAEKGVSLMAMKRYKEAIDICRDAVAKHPGNEFLTTVYVTIGNALDEQGKSDEALAAYDEGIAAFPTFYLLHFNKAITLVRTDRVADAITSLKDAVWYNPDHPGSHNAMATILNSQGKKVQALMATCRFLVLEPQSKRSEINLARFKALMGVQDKSKSKSKQKNQTIYITPDMLNKMGVDGQVASDNFGNVEMLLALSSVMINDKKMIKQFGQMGAIAQQLEVLFKSMKEKQAENHGFFWEYYVPYFIDMYDNDQVKTFVYIAFASSGDSEVDKWISNNRVAIRSFYDWSKSYVWPAFEEDDEENDEEEYENDVIDDGK